MRLDLTPHPEGGHYRQTWAAGNEGRPSATLIYFMLQAGERSHWHRVDATEVWLFHAGAALILSMAASDDGPAHDHLLSPDLSEGAPQLIVPKAYWHSARSTGDWTLVSCVVSPGFTFDGFTLAPAGMEIPR